MQDYSLISHREIKMVSDGNKITENQIIQNHNS